MPKYASMSGLDLRTSAPATANLPTDDSKKKALKLLRQSSAEVGPLPKSPKLGSGVPMDPMMDDPLVQYLKKTAAKDTPERNLTDMPLGPEERSLTKEDPEPTAQMDQAGNQQNKSTLGSLFDHKPKARKNDKKVHSYDPGVVDRILGL